MCWEESAQRPAELRCRVVVVTANISIPVEELDDSERGGVSSSRRSNPVKSSLSDVDKIDVFVSLAKGKKTKSADSNWESKDARLHMHR